MPPFTPAMAHRHKKGLSARQARQWAHVATSTYNACVRDGGAASICEARAIRAGNSVTGEPELSTERRLTLNTALTVPPTRLTLNNRDYLTAPAVLIVQGVLNNGYIPAESLVANDWNHCCVVVNHPMDTEGGAMSARSPEVLATCGMGYLYRCRLGTGQRAGQSVRSLQAEIWLDIAQVQGCSPEAQQAMTMLESQQRLEVSTGFYADAVREQGSAYGMPYSEILYNLRPDHLALLPNGVGACDWASGCGVPRLNEDEQHLCTCPPNQSCTCEEGALSMEEEEPTPRGWRGFVQVLRTFLRTEQAAEPDESEPTPMEAPAEPPTGEDADENNEDAETPADVLLVEQTDTDLRESLYGALAREMGVNVTPIYIDSTDASTQSFTYRLGERLCRRYWSMDGEILTLHPDVEDVQRETTYTTVPGSERAAADDQEVRNPMTMQTLPLPIKTRVNRLIANGALTGWSEDHRHKLEQMDEATLIVLEGLPQRTPPVEPHDPTTLEEALARVPAQFRETLSNATRAYEKRKTQLIDILIANKRNPFAREELIEMTADRLENLVMMAGEELPEQPARPHQVQDYSARRMPQLRIVNEDQDSVPEMPKTMDLVVQRKRELGLLA